MRAQLSSGRAPALLGALGLVFLSLSGGCGKATTTTGPSAFAAPKIDAISPSTPVATPHRKPSRSRAAISESA